MDTSPEMPETCLADGNPLETSGEATDQHSESKFREEIMMSDEEVSSQVESVKRLLVEGTDGYNIPQLERLYTRIIKGVLEVKDTDGNSPKALILKYLLKFAEDKAKF